MSQQIYRMHDQTPDGMHRISESDAKNWNEQGYGIFVTVNSFRGPRRMENLEKVFAWAIDIDSGSKADMEKKIRSGLTPSLVVESKRGYHVWWLAKNAEAKYWNAIVLDRLVPFYGADKNARDLCRVLRMPGYNHLKDPSDPFLVKKVFQWDVSYTQEQMAGFYPDRSKPEREKFKRDAIEFNEKENFWERVWRMDCLSALEKLSGSTHVNFETYSFKRNTNGKYNIYVDGKGTSCFVCHELRIGSLSKGGPTVFNWLRWYGHSPSTAIQILKETFPELGEPDGD